MLTAWSIVSSAATYEVGPEAAIPTLTEALEVVRSGDIIEVAPGAYSGAYYVGALEIEIVGVGGSAQTTLLPPQDITGLPPILVLQDGASVTLRGFTLDGQDLVPGLVVRSSTFVGQDLVLQGTLGLEFPSLSAQNATLTVTQSTFEGLQGTEGLGHHGALLRSVATFEDVLFRGAHGPYGGGSLYLEETTGTFRRCTFEDNQSEMDGGALMVATVSGHETWIEDSLFQRNVTPGYGAAVLQSGGSLHIVRSTFRDHEGRGTINQDGAALFHLQDSLVGNNHGPASGAGVAVYNVNTTEILRSTFQGNSCVADGPAINISGVSYSAEIAGNHLCDNVAGRVGGAIALYSYGSLQASVHHNVFVSNHATEEGAAVFASQVYLDMTQNTVVDSSSATNQGAVWLDPQASARLWNNALVNNDGGAIVRDPASGEVLTGYNLLFGNENVPTRLAVDLTEVLDEPGFVAYTPDDCSSNLRPAEGSALVDRGDPALLDDDTSRSDIGAYGGAGASTLLDLDGDGALEDCAPYDPHLSVPTDEVVADGLDQDCDGADLCYVDSDGDGLGSEALAPAPDCTAPGFAPLPGDCDDADPARTQCAEEEDERGGELPPAWFCSTTGGSPGGWLGLCLLAAQRRRCRGGSKGTST
jgi:hypothetical protein